MIKPKPTNASDGSRTDAHGGNSRGELVAAIDAAQREYDAACVAVRACQARLAALNGEVKGTRLTDHRYRTLCQEQVEVKRRLAEAESTVAERKRRLKALTADLFEFDQAAQVAGSRSAQVAETNRLLGLVLTELRAIRRHMEGNDG